MILQVKVTPNASKNELLGFTEGVLRIKIKGVPEKGRVNEALIEYLSKILGIAKSRIALASGHTSRLKRLKIEGLNQEDVIRLTETK
jgi:uncharacterized protein (TIGR00251 family)